MRDLICMLIAGAVMLGLGTAWAYAYVIPSDAHRERVLECMGEDTHREAHDKCHDKNIGEAGGLVPYLTPPTSAQ